MVRFTVTNRSGSMIRQLTLNVCCWLAEVRLAGPQVCFERGADMPSLRCKKLSGNKVVLVYQWQVNLGAAPAR